jgi:hypothetical protein
MSAITYSAVIPIISDSVSNTDNFSGYSSTIRKISQLKEKIYNRTKGRGGGMILISLNPSHGLFVINICWQK